MELRRPTRAVRFVGFSALAAGLAAAAGCLSMGFEKMPAGDAGAAYAAFCADLLDPGRSAQWVWARGRTAGEFDGDFDTDEEAVVVTLQEGTPVAPGPIQTAVLLVCRRPPGEPVRLLARHVLFDAARPPADAALPEGIYWPKESADAFTEARVEVARPDDSGRGLVLAMLWRKRPGYGSVVWHRGFTLEREAPLAPVDASGAPAATSREAGGPSSPPSAAPASGAAAEASGPTARTLPPAPAPEPAVHALRPVFSTLAVQDAIGVGVRDVDRDGHRELLVAERALPNWAEDIPDLPVPTWTSAWTAVGATGEYRQDDARAARAYEPLLDDWYRAYAEAMAQGAAPERLAYFQYYLGRLHRILGDRPSARRRLAEAERGAASEPGLLALVRAEESAVAAAEASAQAAAADAIQQP